MTVMQNDKLGISIMLLIGWVFFKVIYWKEFFFFFWVIYWMELFVDAVHSVLLDCILYADRWHRFGIITWFRQKKMVFVFLQSESLLLY